MAFELNLGDLASRQIRTEVAPEGREIGDLLDIFDDEDDGLVGTFRTLYTFVKGVGGFLLEKISRIRLPFSSIFGWFVNGFNFLRNFDWNASDAELQAGLKQRNLAVADAWGSFFGQLAGTLTVGALGVGGAFLIPSIGGKTLALSTIKKLYEERGDEVFEELRFAIRQTAVVFGERKFIQGYIKIRRFIKERFPQLKNWGADDGDRWTIAEKFEEQIDKIGNDTLRTFLESFFDEFEEAFIEGGYVIAGHWDNMLVQTQETKLEVLGEDKGGAISIRRGPEDDADGQLFRYIQLPSNLAIATVQHQLNTYRSLQNINIGEFGGDPDDSDKVGEPYLRTAKIILRGDKDKPPFVTPLGAVSSRHTITLKSLKPNLRWRDFKRAFRFLEWGPWKIEATLESRVTFAIYAANREYGVAKIKEIISELIDEEAIRIAATIEEVDPRVRKIPKTIFPEEAIVTLKRESTLGEIVDLSGQRYVQEQIRFDLWRDDEPFGTPEYVTNYQTIRL